MRKGGGWEAAELRVAHFLVQVRDDLLRFAELNLRCAEVTASLLVRHRELAVFAFVRLQLSRELSGLVVGGEERGESAVARELAEKVRAKKNQGESAQPHSLSLSREEEGNAPAAAQE